MMAMPGTVQSISFSTHRRNTLRLDGPLPLRLLPKWDRITATGQEPTGEKTRSLTHLILLANMARRGPLPRPGLVRSAGNVPADAPPRAFVLPAVCADPTLLPYTAGTPGPCRPSSPHGSTAPGSCGSHSALESERFRAYACAARSTAPDDLRSDTSFAQSPELYTRVVHSPDSMPSSALPAGDAGRALQLFSQHILQHDLIQRQLSHKLLELGVLISKLLDLPYLVHFQAGILRLPAIVGLFRNPNLPDQLRYRNSDFGLLQHSTDLLYRKLLPHGKILLPGQGEFFCRKLTFKLVPF